MRDASKLFAGQDGLATSAQLRARNVERGVVRQRTKAGEWERLGRSVLAVPGADTWRRRVRAAQLTAGEDAAISHVTAGRLHGLDGCEHHEQIHLTVCDAVHRTSLPAVAVHRSGLLDIEACDHVDGMLVVSRPVALVQIAATVGRDAAAKALDGMLRAGDSPIWIDGVVRSWKRRGVRGPAIVLDLLHQRVAATLPRSWFQRLVSRVLLARGIQMIDEYRVHDTDGTLLAELDLAIPELRIGIECQSWRWHGSPAAQAADARRKRRLRLLGWEIVDVWWSDLRRGDEIAEEVVYLTTRRLAERPLP